MAFFPKDSAIQVAPGSELEKAIASASSVSEIQTLLHEAARAQHLIQPDEFDPRGDDYFSFRPTDPGSIAAAKSVAKTVTVNGQKHIIEGSTDAELVANELKLMRSLFGQNDQQQGRDANGRFVSQSQEEKDAAEARQILDAVDAEESRRAAIADPAAAASAKIVRDALIAQGIDPEALAEFTQARQNEAYITSWADAAHQFQERHPEWVGGEENKNILANLLAENNLADSEDKVGAMEAVYDFAVKNNLLVANPELVQQDAIAKATTPEELRLALGRDPYAGGGFFGR